MSAASDLIERMERETGQRIYDNDGDNNAVAGCIGAIARMMGNTAHTDYADDPKIDVPVGMYIKATSTPEYKARERSKELMLEMFMAGLTPNAPGERPGANNQKL